MNQFVSEAVVSNSLAEPTFAEIGLGGWSPSGIVQSCFEWLHISCDLPWWGCIAIGILYIVIIVLITLVLTVFVFCHRCVDHKDINISFGD